MARDSLGNVASVRSPWIRLAAIGVVLATWCGVAAPRLSRAAVPARLAVRVRLQGPQAGEVVRWGTTRRLSWTARDPAGRASRATIFLSQDGGLRWRRVAALPDNPGWYDWRVHEVEGVKRNCLVKVTLFDAGGAVVGIARSAGAFTIRGLSPRYGLGEAEGWTLAGYLFGKTVAADLDGDGRQEMAMLAHGGDGCRDLFIVRREADGTLPILQHVITLVLDFKDLDTGDLNGDGRTDLAISAVSTLGGGCLARLLVLFQDPLTGAMGTTSREMILYSDAVGELEIADLDGNGLNDVALMTESTFDGGPGAVSIFHQASPGAFLPEKRYTGCPVALAGRIRAVDMNNDGSEDLVIQSGGTTVAVIRQDAAAGAIGLDPAPEVIDIGSEGGRGVSSFAIGDLDNDGWRDIAVASTGQSLLLYRREPGGTFALFRTIAVSSEPHGLVVADLDGDRLDDILAEWPGIINVYRQTCTHKFGAPAVKMYCYLVPGNVPGSFVHGKVTPDGIPDLLVSGIGGELTIIPGARLP